MFKYRFGIDSKMGKYLKIYLNPNKTESILFSWKRTANTMPDLFMKDIKIEYANSHKHLGQTPQHDGQLPPMFIQ